MKQTEGVYIIRNKTTKTIFTAPYGKNIWKKPVHAEDAWKTVKPRGKNRKDIGKFIELMSKLGIDGVTPQVDGHGNVSIPYFNNQDVYEIINLDKEYFSGILTKAEAILQACSGNCSSEVQEQIDDYFRSK